MRIREVEGRGQSHRLSGWDSFHLDEALWHLPDSEAEMQETHLAGTR